MVEEQTKSRPVEPKHASHETDQNQRQKDQARRNWDKIRGPKQKTAPPDK